MKIKNLLYLLLLTTILSSCALEKRHYRSGYYVNNKTSVAQASGAKKAANENAQEQSDIVMDDAGTSAELASVENNPNVLINKPGALADINVKSTKYEEPVAAAKKPGNSKLQDRKSEKSKTDTAGSSYDERRIDIVSLLSFIFSMLGLLLLLTVGFPFLMGTAGLVLGIIGVSRINKNRDVYTGKGFAIAGIIIGSLIILIMWLILVLVILLVGMMA